MLTAEERQSLDVLVRRPGTAQQVALRAWIVVAAAEGRNNAEIARQAGVDMEAARRWRTRWLDLSALPLVECSVAERLEDAPRAGGPCRITAEQVCQLTALACEAPAGSARPISQWTGRAIADEAVPRGIVAAISPRHAARLLKRGPCSPIASATG